MKRISHIEVPNDPAYTGAVISYCEVLCQKVGFSEKEIGEMTRALREALDNVIAHALDPYEDESFEVTFEILDNGLKISVAEMGLPFMAAETDEETPSSGLKIIEENTDEVDFINRGKEGKELQLIKYLKGLHVEELFTETELAPYETCKLPPPDTEYTIREMKPEETGEVSRCIYRAYKYTYLNEDLYFPERIESMNKNGSMISFVAVTDEGEIVAHFALLPRPNRKAAEIGVAVVVPEHRKRGLMKILLENLIERAKELEFTTLYGNAFTMHALSQKTNLAFGFSETALQLGVFPPLSVKMLKDRELRGAGNVLTFFLYLDQNKKENYTVYLPPEHREILHKIYRGLDLIRNFEDTGIAVRPPLPERSALKLKIKPFHKTAIIEVISPGADMEERVRAKMLDLENKGFNALYIDLDLKNPSTPQAARVLGEAGFFLAGLLVDYTDGDVLRLQRYFTVVNYDEIEYDSAFAGELTEYIKELDPRWRALKK